MNINFEVYGFIALWLVWCSLPFITPKNLNLLPRTKADTLLWRVLEWHWRFPLFIAAGYLFDSALSNRPHESYMALDFYAILYTSSLVFSVPSLVWYLARHKKFNI